jgi:hypothetical protein
MMLIPGITMADVGIVGVLVLCYLVYKNWETPNKLDYVRNLQEREGDKLKTVYMTAFAAGVLFFGLLLIAWAFARVALQLTIGGQ